MKMKCKTCRRKYYTSPNTTEACPDEEVLAVKTKILRKWEVVKEQHIGGRPSLRKIRKDWQCVVQLKLLIKLLKKSKRRSTHPSLD